MKQLTGARSVPRVFIDGKCIGGGDETMAAHRNFINHKTYLTCSSMNFFNVKGIFIGSIIQLFLTSLMLTYFKLKVIDDFFVI